jgi:DNA polymerase elongation subunit (family B)
MIVYYHFGFKTSINYQQIIIYSITLDQILRDSKYSQLVKPFIASHGTETVLSIDLETLIRSQKDFLTDERIIAISLTFYNNGLQTELFIANNDSVEEEDRLLNELDRFMLEFKPSIIIGYNQCGYDIPLIRLKMRNRTYSRQLWNLKYFLSVAYCLDMMPVISDYLAALDGDYRFRKLSEVVIHEGFSHLPLDRKKSVVIKDGKNIGEVIEELWRSRSTEFLEYCRGDTRDVFTIFRDIFGSSEASKK